MKILRIIGSLVALQIAFLLLVPLQAGAEQIRQPLIEQRHSSTAVDQLTPEEKKWFAKFQEGTFFAQGWKEITEDILAKTPAELVEKQRLALADLGIKIGCEWSKDNDVRKINNDMLKQWGSQLQDTVGQNPDKITDVIVEIDEKVGRLLD